MQSAQPGISPMISIHDESDDKVERHQLRLNGERRASVTRSKLNGQVRFHWAVYGPVPWPEAKELLEGLLELSIVADQLVRTPHERKSKSKARP